VLLQGKRALIMGVANKRSIAWGIASAFHREGADLAFTYQSDRLKENLDELLDTIGGRTAFSTYPCDVTKDDQLDTVFGGLGATWESLDVLVHCLAFANREDLTRPLHETSRDGYALTLDISAYSLVACAGAARPLMQAAGGGSVMTRRAWWPGRSEGSSTSSHTLENQLRLRTVMRSSVYCPS